MRDPFTWSIPLGRFFGITVRVHLLFPLVILPLILRVALQKDPPLPPGSWIDALVVTAMLFVSVLLHEFGHCFAARSVDGDAREVLLWPLGGLASVELPNVPRAHFITAAMGPAVNLGLCVVAVGVLYFLSEKPIAPPWNPIAGYPGRGAVHADGTLDFSAATLTGWGGQTEVVPTLGVAHLAALFFYVNWSLFLLNVLLVGYPLDGGQMLQAALWPSLGFRQSMFVAVFAGYVVACIVFMFGVFGNQVLSICLAGFICVTCRMKWHVLENGGDESLFGYDFSQGYTSLERDMPPSAPPRVRRTSWWQRWLRNRAARRIQRQEETRVSDERRMDELLEKVQRQGIAALTDEEKRFMKRVSDRYKNRH
jgi:Zn-dependent protease